MLFVAKMKVNVFQNEKDVSQNMYNNKINLTFNLNECSILSSDSHSQLQAHAHVLTNGSTPIPASGQMKLYDIAVIK